MYTEPITITVNAVPKVLKRISAGDLQGRFRLPDGTYDLSIKHSAQRRERSVVKLTKNIVAADPLNSTLQRNYVWSAYLVVDAPLNGVGFTDIEQENDIKGLLAWLSSGTVLAQFLGKES